MDAFTNLQQQGHCILHTDEVIMKKKEKKRKSLGEKLGCMWGDVSWDVVVAPFSLICSEDGSSNPGVKGYSVDSLESVGSYSVISE